jgi:putative PIN family toxin of toxin-antitoxin system
MENAPHVVIDTNVIFSGLRSKHGASFQVISLLGSGRFEIHLSVPLVLEHEEVLSGHKRELDLTTEDINDFLNYLCEIAYLHDIHFLWRPLLKDPDDEMILELAVSAGCSRIVTYNKSDFDGVDPFGIELVTAKEELLEQIGALP